MKIRLFTLVLYFTLGFAINLYYNTYYVKDIDPRIKPYYTNFMIQVENKCNSSQYKNSSYQIKFNKLEEKDDSYTIGVCYTFKYSDKFKIDLSEEYWNMADEVAKYHLIAHEGLHCLFGLDHSDNPKDVLFYRLNYIPMEELVKQVDMYLESQCQK